MKGNASLDEVSRMHDLRVEVLSLIDTQAPPDTIVMTKYEVMHLAAVRQGEGGG